MDSQSFLAGIIAISGNMDLSHSLNHHMITIRSTSPTVKQRQPLQPSSSALPPVPTNPGEGQCEIKGGLLGIGHQPVPAAQGDGRPCTIGDFNHENVHGKFFTSFRHIGTIHAIRTHFLSFLKGWPFPVRAPKDQQVRTCGGFDTFIACTLCDTSDKAVASFETCIGLQCFVDLDVITDCSCGRTSQHWKPRDCFAVSVTRAAQKWNQLLKKNVYTCWNFFEERKHPRQVLEVALWAVQSWWWNWTNLENMHCKHLKIWWSVIIKNTSIIFRKHCKKL